MLSESEALTEDGVPWSPWAAAGLWAAGFFGSAVWVSFLLTLNGSNDDFSASVPWLFVGQLALWAAYGVGPLILARQHGVSYVSVFDLDFRGKDVAIWGFVGLVVQIVVIPLVYVPLRSIIDSDDVGEQAEKLIETAGNPSDAILLFVMIVLIAPVVEELFFRGVALPAIVPRLGVPAAVIVSSIWFAASHLQLVQFPGLLAVGLVLGFCRVYTRSLVPAVALHMAFNGVTFGVLVSQLDFS